MSGSTPAYRDLTPSDSAGPDITELNRNLVALGFDPSAIVVDDVWQAATTAGVEVFQASLGETETGSLSLGHVVFLPGPRLIATVNGTVGSTGGGRQRLAGRTRPQLTDPARSSSISTRTSVPMSRPPARNTQVPGRQAAPARAPIRPTPRPPAAPSFKPTARCADRAAAGRARELKNNRAPPPRHAPSPRVARPRVRHLGAAEAEARGARSRSSRPPPIASWSRSTSQRPLKPRPSWVRRWLSRRPAAAPSTA